MKFILEVPLGVTHCDYCPFFKNMSVCKYLSENKLCDEYDFSNANLEDVNEEV